MEENESWRKKTNDYYDEKKKAKIMSLMYSISFISTFNKRDLNKNKFSTTYGFSCISFACEFGINVHSTYLFIFSFFIRLFIYLFNKLYEKISTQPYNRSFSIFGLKKKKKEEKQID